MMIRGGTYIIEITVTNSDTGAPLDLSGVEGILVGLYGDGRRLFGKWSYIDKTADGFGPVTITNAAGGVIEVALERTATLNALEKLAKLEVVVALPNPAFDGGTQYSIDTEISLELVTRSVFEGVNAT